MPITFKKGDMFAEPVEAIVNTVNCVGVMGKGVALEFKKRWPANYKAYKKICDAKELSPGQMFVFDTQQLFPQDGPRYLVNFPTKAHWRSKSKLIYVEEGLDALVEDIQTYKMKSIAIPPLGCGNGGLKWSDVCPLIVSKLRGLDDVDVVVFPPRDAVDAPEHANTSFPLTYERAVLLKGLGDLEAHFDGAFDRISLQKIAYFLQALGVALNISFSRNLYGPYSEKLRRSFVAFEKRGMLDGFTTGDRQTRVTPSAYAAADEYLSDMRGRNEDVIVQLDKLIQGYESPYGMELLSSVHWLAAHEKHYPVEKIIAEMMQWNENKRNAFTPEAIRAAYDRLVEDKLLH